MPRRHALSIRGLLMLRDKTLDLPARKHDNLPV